MSNKSTTESKKRKHDKVLKDEKQVGDNNAPATTTTTTATASTADTTSTADTSSRSNDQSTVTQHTHSASKTTAADYGFPHIPYDIETDDYDPNDISGIPENVLLNPTYWRRLNLDNIAFHVADSKSDFMENECELRTIPKPGSKNNRVIPIIITTPPLRGRYFKLDGTGNYPSSNSEITLKNAQFVAAMVEGNVPDDIKVKYPALEREQRAFFDRIEYFDAWIKKQFYKHPSIGQKEKEMDQATVFRLLGLNEESYKSKDPKIIEKLNNALTEMESMFVSKHKGFIRLGEDNIRKVVAKKAVSVDRTSKLYPTKNNRAKFFPTGDSSHYIDQLNVLSRDYSPVKILDRTGNAVKTGTYNEIPVLQNNDMVIATLIPKLFSGTQNARSHRFILVSLQVVRQARPEEVNLNDGGFVDWAEDFVAPPIADITPFTTAPDTKVTTTTNTSSTPSPTSSTSVDYSINNTTSSSSTLEQGYSRKKNRQTFIDNQKISYDIFDDE